METKVLLPTKDNIAYAAELLQKGEVCGMPTETVYGLAADALNEAAVKKIFAAKGRPQDNPLIVHISCMDEMAMLVSELPQTAKMLAQEFWPGPLTMIMKKSDNVPYCVTAGLDTVAIRMPSHKVAAELIRVAGRPLAAPSANISGRPSPTTAEAVFHDLNGKIPAVLDGGECEFGLESTVLLTDDKNGVTMLRPGAVTVDMLKSVVGNVKIADGVLNRLDENEQALSPGMKHKHYSPETNIVILDASFDKFKEFIENNNGNIGAMVFCGEEAELTVPCVAYGSIDNQLTQAHSLFACLRDVDSLGVETVYARMPQAEGVGLAVYNRLLRAAGFEVKKL